MVQYQYNGEHHRVVIEGIAFVQGEVKTLFEDDEKILLSSGFGQAMLKSGELIKLDAKEQDEAPKEPVKKLKKAKDEPIDVEITAEEGEPK